jgi:TRAP-type mannitol/chloroaromatic compound transport system substrate-binding protein
MSWKAADRYSQDYVAMQTKDNVKFYKTPDSILQEQLKVWDQVAAKKSAENPLFKKVNESMRAFAERAVRWQQDTMVTSRIAYNHFFAKKG